MREPSVTVSGRGHDGGIEDGPSRIPSGFEVAEVLRERLSVCPALSPEQRGRLRHLDYLARGSMRAVPHQSHQSTNLSPRLDVAQLARAMDELDGRIRQALPFVADVFIDVTAGRTEEDSRAGTGD
jgi:hypothetical protein